VAVVGEVGERRRGEREHLAAAAVAAGEEGDQRLRGAAGDALDHRRVIAEVEPGGGSGQHRPAFVARFARRHPDRHRRAAHRGGALRRGERRPHEVGDDVAAEEDEEGQPKRPA
jgi:hypothetical protein